MLRIIEPGRCRWVFMMTLGWVLAAWPADVVGQETSPSVPLVPLPSQRVAPSDLRQDLPNHLRKIEQRLDQLTKQNENLTRQNKTLEEQVRDLWHRIGNHG